MDNETVCDNFFDLCRYYAFQSKSINYSSKDFQPFVTLQIRERIPEIVVWNVPDVPKPSISDLQNLNLTNFNSWLSQRRKEDIIDEINPQIYKILVKLLEVSIPSLNTPKQRRDFLRDAL